MPMRLSRSIAVLCASGIWAGLARGAEPAPRVVVAWAGGPMEARVAFDRAVDPELARRVVGESIGFGEGEKPGVVGRAGGDRGSLRVAAARLVDEGRTLVLVTDPHPRESTYHLTLPGLKVPGELGPGRRVEVAYDLGGVEASYASGGEKRSTWWPSVDTQLARDVTSGSAGHARFFSGMARDATLTLETLVAAPKGEMTLNLEASAPFEAMFGVETMKSVASKPDAHRATLKVESTGEPIFFTLALPGLEAAPSRIRAAIGPEPLPRSAFVLPWAPPSPPPAAASEVPAALLTGGDPAKGETIFFGDQAKCSACHRVGDKGGVVGPDLSSLLGRDRAWVYRNINEPSASIHPDYVTYTVSLKDGRVAMGVVRAEGADALKVADIDAKQTIIPRAEVEEIRPSASSIMPVGLLGAIGEEATRDLLAYLTSSRAPKARR
jgi:putative heme-binding domain-containing protein